MCYGVNASSVDVTKLKCRNDECNLVLKVRFASLMHASFRCKCICQARICVVVYVFMLMILWILKAGFWQDIMPFWLLTVGTMTPVI